MRALLLTNDYPPRAGGIQRYLGDLTARWPGEVRILAPRDDAAGSEDAVRRSRWPFMWPTRAVARWVEEQAREFRPDVLVFGAPAPLAVLGPSLRKALGIPYVVMAYGAEVTVPAAIPLVRRMITFPLRRAEVVFALSRFVAGRLRRLTDRPVRYLGAGVDLDRFRPAEGDRPAGRPVVGSVSRFVPRKGQLRLIRAVARLREEGHDVELLLAGTGPLEDRLRAAMEELGVPGALEADLPWEDVSGVYRRMDVFALPVRSRWLGLEAEGLGIVLLEAAAAGLPVIAGDSGGAPETVVPGVTGFLCRSDAHLDEGLRLLLSAPERARAMGERGRSMVEEAYSWEDVVARLRSGLEEAVGTAGE